MDQQTRTGGTYVVAVLLFMIAFIFFCMGIGLLLSFPDKIALIGAAILGFSAVFIYSGLRNLKDAKLMDRDAQVQLNLIKRSADIQTDNEIEPVAANHITILARWQYSKGEWTRFMIWERSRRKTSSTVEAVLIIVLGSLVLRSLRDASWIEAIAISGIMAVIYWLGKYYISMSSFGRKKLNEVVITNRSVIINGKVNAFSDGLYWLKKVELIEEENISLIEFVYGWNTRKGPGSEEIRVPVPANKIEEAKKLVRLY